jgi:hypothetical protein
MAYLARARARASEEGTQHSSDSQSPQRTVSTPATKRIRLAHCQEKIMKRVFTASVAMALMAMAVTSFAQSTDQPAQPTAEQTNHKDPADQSKGQDLVNPKATDTNPTTVGQDKSTGNNLVQPKDKGMAMGARPEFKTIDMKNQGYVMASDVRDPWLKQNFSKCDKDADGKVTRAEYGMCAK